jgi:hypothetical protein
MQPDSFPISEGHFEKLRRREVPEVDIVIDDGGHAAPADQRRTPQAYDAQAGLATSPSPGVFMSHETRS